MPLVFHAFADKTVGGAERVVLSLLARRKASELCSHVLLPRGSALIPLLRQEKISYTAYKEAKSSFSLFFTLLSLLRETRCDLLVTHGCALARAAGRCAGVPHLVSFKHCATPPPYSLRAYRAITDFTVAVSQNANSCLQKFGIPPCERRVIENGFRFIGCPSQAERTAARAALGIRKGTFAVGMCARLSAVKDHKTAFLALKRLPAHYFLFLLGTGEEQDSLIALAARLGLSSRIVFLGYRSEVRKFYHAMDAHISCSCDSETASLALAEGMSAGCPTVASAIAGNLSRVGEGGSFFPVGDDEALARHLLALEDPAHAARMRENALARAARLPSEEQAREAYERCMLELLR